MQWKKEDNKGAETAHHQIYDNGKATVAEQG
jgi:hypothetical protein